MTIGSILSVFHKAYLIGHSKVIQNKRELFITYFRLKLRHLFCKLLKIKVNSERVFQFKVSFPNHRDFISLFEEIFVYGCYHFTARTTRPLIVDCGSNIGLAILFFKHLYPNSRAICFEPDEETFGFLRKNVEMNFLDDVILINKAIYSEARQMEFYYDPDHLGSGHASLVRGRLPKASKKIESVLLSDYVNEVVDFLKMDVEGVEDKVIEELAQHNKLSLIDQMLIEYHHHIDPWKDELSTFLKVLESNDFGYQISARARQHSGQGEFQDIIVYTYNKRTHA